MRKLALLLVLALIIPSALAVTTDANFDYGAIIGFAQGHYGELYTIVGRVTEVQEYHRSSDTTLVEEYTRIAVDDDPERVIVLHYTRPKNQPQLPEGTLVATLAYVDGVQRIGDIVVPLLEAKSDPIPINDQ